MRITDRDLRIKEEVVNGLLRKISLKVTRRYDYTAIDIYSKTTGEFIDTLAAGLTKRQAFEVLESIERVLRLESKA